MTIEIGGELPAGLINEFFAALDSDCYDTTGPITDGELRQASGKPIKFYATSNYGECDDIKAFCIKHKLGYIHYVDATNEYNASLSYWVPGMKNETCLQSNQESDVVVNIYEIKPIINLLLEYAKRGKDAIPLFIGDKFLTNIIEKCCKKPGRTLQIIEKRINQLLPGEPKLPPFTIKE